MNRKTALPKERTFTGTPCEAINPRILDSQTLICGDCESGGAVQLFREGLSEEAATPEFTETRRSAFLKTLPMIHPRESPVTTSFVSVASRINAAHVCTAVTLSESRINRNGKLIPCCAETVEDETSLWKGKEKAEEIRGHGFTPMNTDKSLVVLPSTKFLLPL
jgi:hypothetical protein